jgi:hypothetical protein
MKLKLAIVKSCDQEGCIVNSIGDEEELSVAYSRLVKERIKISENQLVAMDLDRPNKELVWRWIRTDIDQVLEDSVVLDDRRCQLLPAFVPPELALKLEIGDEVWACKTGEAIEVHAKTGDLDHDREMHLIRYIQPIILKHHANG